MHVLFISKTYPGPLLGGGPARTYQVLYELQEFFGAENVTLMPAEEILSHVDPQRALLDRAIARWRRWAANPFPSLGTARSTVRGLSDGPLRRYREALQSHAGISFCVLEGANLAPLVAVNDQLGIKTVLAPWSFDALTDRLTRLVSAFRGVRKKADTRLQVYDVFTKFADDAIFSAGIARTWLLSRLECGFLQASGLQASYVPYYPVGEAEESLRAIRHQRRREAGLFVICGGGNAQNQMALENFLQQLRKQDLPVGARIAIAGVTQMPEHWTAHLDGSIQFFGRLPKADFDALLARAQAVLVPQTCGFGCMTRVADMLCAGIPVVADAIVANGTGGMPGVHYVMDAPGAWSEALHEALKLPAIFPDADFMAWHQAQRAAVHREFARFAVP